MLFRNLPDGLPTEVELRRFTRRLHQLGEPALQSFLERLLADQMPTASSIVIALDHPDQFAVDDETGTARRWAPYPRPLCRSEDPTNARFTSPNEAEADES